MFIVCFFPHIPPFSVPPVYFLPSSHFADKFIILSDCYVINLHCVVCQKLSYNKVNRKHGTSESKVFPHKSKKKGSWISSKQRCKNTDFWTGLTENRFWFIRDPKIFRGFHFGCVWMDKSFDFDVWHLLTFLTQLFSDNYHFTLSEKSKLQSICILR